MDIYNISDVKDYPFELLNPEFEQIKYDNELKKLINKPIKFSYYFNDILLKTIFEVAQKYKNAKSYDCTKTQINTKILKLSYVLVLKN
ncbi:uncharacterized protein OCT59_011750 [Rhizophagus irregularis]|uniref:uncharacterized protein n=1 Tax=Rhizophagus irregularis TaxID=588596 RepID=UPI003331D81A|nr:hypothetical protein OCT59_011750 [Rhizophagus irregularis]